MRSKSRTRRLIAAIVVAAAFIAPLAACGYPGETIIVNDGGSGGGSSW